jgi:acyl-CoA thioester hydrolase
MSETYKGARDHVSIVRYRVCYEDTDAGGVVYYANYLRYMERGRNGYLRDLGMSVRQFQERGILFPVVEVNLRYHAPAVLEDDLIVESWIEKAGRGSILFGQRVLRDGKPDTLVEGTVLVACVDRDMKPRRLPEEVRHIRVEG